ncbi:MAG: RNA 2',3'-cyclic phosphodiesterase [candidate division WOR-3 bacterium]
MIRSFIAISIPEEVKKEISKIVKEYEAKKYPFRWVAPENLHITLIFLGEVSEKFLLEAKSEIKKVAERTKSFPIRLGGFGAFPSLRNPRVIWIGVPLGGKEVEELQKDLVESLTRIGFKPEEKKFHPHLTIARAKGSLKEIDLWERRYESEEFLVDRVILFKSTLTPEGPIYNKIEEYPLMDCVIKGVLG